MLHNQPLPNDCYRVSIDQSLVDAAFIPAVGNNKTETVIESVGAFCAWPKDQVILDEEVHMCFFNLHIYIILHI